MAREVAVLRQVGRFADAAEANARRLATTELAADVRAAAETLRGRLVALVDGRFALALRFTGELADPWATLVPSAVRGDPVGRRLVVEARRDAGTVVAWALRRDGPRVLARLEVAERQIDVGAGIGVELRHGDDALLAGLGLFAGRDGLLLRCGRRRVRLDRVDESLQLQLDVDAEAGTVTCRAAGGGRHWALQEPLDGADRGGLRLELRAGG